MNVLEQTGRLFAKFWGERVFVATVDSVSGNQISVIRSGETAVEGPYPAAAGLAAAVSAGDRVKVQVVGGVPHVEYEITT